ncbi:hypothetical protein [Streptomonospora arabica]|uniref:DUF8017 domain-containing protein n=1 Tax=Streptomonospora arabica TaxID=412417 RepID=A0ABV9SMI7_9ACTN
MNPPEPPLPPQTAPHRPNNQGRGIAVAVMSTVAVLGVGVVVLIVLMFQSISLPQMPQMPAAGGGGDGGEGGSGTASPSPKESPVTIATPDSDDLRAVTAELTPGWQGVEVEERGIAYDVPEAWFVESPDLVSGFTDDGQGVGMGGSAVSGAREGPCYSYPPAPGRAGIAAVGQVADTAQTAAETADTWAGLAYSNEEGRAEVSATEPVPFAANGLVGHQVTVEVQAPEFDCYPTQAVLRVVSFLSPAGDDVFNFIVFADTAGPLAPEVDLDTMTASLRPLP